MNSEMLSQNFATLTEAPGGIDTLRQLILQLAVRGKLVSQNPDDEPASALLERVKVEKERLVKEGLIKRTKYLPQDDISSHKIPIEWEMENLGNIAHMITKGSTPTTYGYQFQNEGIRFVKVENVKNGHIVCESIKHFISEQAHQTQKRSQLQPYDILFSIAGTIGETCVVHPEDLPANTNQALAIIRGIDSILYPPFLKLQLDSFVSNAVKSRARGGAMNNVSLGDLKYLTVYLPPLAEQHRIVSKVDQLMNLCDELERKQQKRSEVHIRMNNGALSKLQQPSNEAEFDQVWAYIRDNFDLLYTKQETVKKLREAVLQLAVQGRLVEQDPNDEPASVLLERIAEEKERLKKEGKLKSQKKLPPIDEDEVPYELPLSWKWTRLGDVLQFINGDRGKNYPSSKDKVDSGIPFINAGHLVNGEVSFKNMNFITIDKFNSLGSGKIKKNDVIYCIRGTLGKSAVVNKIDEGAISSSLVLMRSFYGLKPEFLYNYLNSFLGKVMVNLHDNGTAQPNLAASNVKKYLFPLPPLAEQHRIVEKVDRLMTFCDRLEENIKHSEEVSRSFAEAIGKVGK